MDVTAGGTSCIGGNIRMGLEEISLNLFCRRSLAASPRLRLKRNVAPGNRYHRPRYGRRKPAGSSSMPQPIVQRTEKYRHPLLAPGNT